ncbi:MAG: GTP-binding protein, partial [Acaryochloridaceae cyanobacterium RL_2_7]|nr:GTP-binding protein [Acaryochloridaceae cyanobacterium RL_2_7]
RFSLPLPGRALVEMTGWAACAARCRANCRRRFLKTAPGGLDRVVIETSGLADPQPMMRTLVADPDVAARFAHGGVVTLVDMKNFMALAQEFRELRSQVAFADRIVLTKLDAIGDDQVEETVCQVTHALRALNHHSPILNLDEGPGRSVAIEADELGRRYLAIRGGAEAVTLSGN